MTGSTPEARRPGCIVTGAAAGIGRAIAVRLASDGYAVACVDRDAEGVLETCASIGDAAEALVVDLGDRVRRRQVVPQTVEKFGQVELLVNNAAYHGPRLGLLDLPLSEWDRVVETNLIAAVDLSRAFADHVSSRGIGSIINITSIQAALPVATYSAYGASKGAISAMTRSLAVELAPWDIRVNAVAPGVIHTDAFQRSLEDADDALVEAPAAALLGRGGRPEEVAGAVSFLASDDASYITGVVLPVDGGRRISRKPDPFETGFQAK